MPSRTLTRQSRASITAWQADAQARPGGAWTELDGLALHSTGIPEPHWNGAVLTAAAGLARIPAATRWFAERAMPWGLVVPAEIDVAPPGMVHVVDQPVMTRHLTGVEAGPDHELRWDAGEDAAAVQAEAFEVPLGPARDFVLPKLRCPVAAVVVAYDGGHPVATATLFAVARVGAVYGVGTVASHRRRGFGAAVTRAVLQEAVRRGCDLAFLNPSPSGYGVYRSLGFVDTAPNRIYRASSEGADDSR